MLSADLLVISHELSKIWERSHTFVETPLMKMIDTVSDTVLKFKSNKILKIQKDLVSQIDEAYKADDTEKVGRLLKRHADLSEALGQISKKLGNRILL
jgi:hypothetical protein